nr:tetratricopeptide-like helical domain, DYW domain protein [Tanacetum cinerariifolium]
MSNAPIESPPSTSTDENAAIEIPVEISTPFVDLEMSALDEGPTPPVRIRGAVRMRRKEDGSRAYMYPGGKKPIGFGISWDPVDGEAMLGVSIPTLASPIGITPEDCRIHAQRPEPVMLQEAMLEPLVKRIIQYQRRIVVHQEPVQQQEPRLNAYE